MKIHNTRIALMVAAIAFVFSSCDRTATDSRWTTMGYKPIYATSANLNELVRSTAARPLTGSGKIYVKGNLLLINKPYEGIHVVDNADPSNPKNLSFVEIPGNLDVAMKGDYLYADFAGQIAVIDLKDVSNPKLVQGVSLSTEFQQYPPNSAANTMWQGSRVYFECPNPKKGVVIGWVFTELSNPKCYR